MATPTFSTEAAAAGSFPAYRFNQRERKLLASVLAAFGAPVYVAKFAGTYTTLGGSATEAQTLAGVASTDIVIATLKAKGATPRTILTSAPTTNTLTYVFSGDPSTDHVVSYLVLRAI